MWKNIVMVVLAGMVILCFFFPTNVNKAVQLEKKEIELNEQEQELLEWSQSINAQAGRARMCLDNIQQEIEALDVEWKRGKLVDIQSCEDYNRAVLVLQGENGEVVNLIVSREEFEKYVSYNIDMKDVSEFVGQEFWYSLENEWILKSSTMPHYGLKKVVTLDELAVQG